MIKYLVNSFKLWFKVFCVTLVCSAPDFIYIHQIWKPNTAFSWRHAIFEKNNELILKAKQAQQHTI